MFYLTFLVWTPSPQFSFKSTLVTLQTLQGSVIHMYWLQSLWQGTTSYTCNPHSASVLVHTSKINMQKWPHRKSINALFGKNKKYELDYLDIILIIQIKYLLENYWNNKKTEVIEWQILWFSLPLSPCCAISSKNINITNIKSVTRLAHEYNFLKNAVKTLLAH